MRLGIDITPLQIASPGGIGTALYEVLRVLPEVAAGHEVVLYGRSAPQVPFSGAPLDVSFPQRTGTGPLSQAGNIAWLQYGIAPMLRHDRIDVFWGTRHVLPRNAAGVALVATAHDFWYAFHPEQQPWANRTLNSYVTRCSMRDADVVVAISDSTAMDARRLFPASADRVRTVLLGVDAARFSPRSAAVVSAIRARFWVGERYVLAMDAYNPRKSFGTILQACARVMPTTGGFDIVALGRPRSSSSGVDVAGTAASLGLSERVRLPGDVSADDLAALYSGAAAFVYPSVYEGFGMPVLEAMACGAPVVCSGVSSLPQVAGDAAILVARGSAGQIGDALVRIFGEPGLRERLVTAGLARASELTWESSARGILAACDDAFAVTHGRGPR